MKKEKKDKGDFVKLYVPELLQLVESGDEKMCLMMAQLEYWFKVKPDGFYKFMTPAKGDNLSYRAGDSWTEEMGMSDTKIANGLKPICTRYQSYSAYKMEKGDKFKGKFYCSYFHKPSHQTYYFRNHDVVNEALESLSLGKKSTIFLEKHSTKVGNAEKGFSGHTETTIPDFIDVEVVYTENNQKNNQKNNPHTIQEREEENSHFREKREKDVIKEKEDGNDFHYNEHYSNEEDIVQGIIEDEDEWQAAKNLAVPFPADFELTEEMISWAKEKKPQIDVKDSTDKFKIYNAGNFNKDWYRKWQLWILSEKTTAGNSSVTSGSSQVEFYKGTKGRYDHLVD